MNESMQTALRKLRLSGLAQTLDVRLQEAASHDLNHTEFLELVLQDELAIRADRQLGRRIKAASFREHRTLEDFDFAFNPSVNKKQIFELATCRFVREAKDLLLLGPPGTGKSHIAQALGYQAIRSGMIVLYRSIFDVVRDVVRDFLHDEAFEGHDRIPARYLKPDLLRAPALVALSIDDMGMKRLPKRSGEYLFEIIMRRHEVRSTTMTSNRPLEDWGKLIGDVPSASAILDRFLSSANLITITGKSYRLRNIAKQANDDPKPTTAKAKAKAGKA